MRQVRRRACLSVPASSARMLEKAPTIAADEIVLDLEDAVAPGAKDGARQAAVAALRVSEWRAGSVAIRVNAPRTPWCHLDLAALAALPRLPVSIVLPKVEGAGDLHFADRFLDGAEAPARPDPIRIQALIETPAGLARVAEIAASSPRLDALIIGYADLAAALGRTGAELDGHDFWGPTRDAVLLAARANGLQAIDGPYLGTKPDERFVSSAQVASRLGFDGKWAIHPSQVAPLEQMFTPTDEEVDHARAVVAALERAEHRTGAGAVALDGEMLDEAVRARALRILTRADVEIGA